MKRQKKIKGEGNGPFFDNVSNIGVVAASGSAEQLLPTPEVCVSNPVIGNY